MRVRFLAPAALLMVAAALIPAAEAPPAAASLLAAGLSQAEAQKKSVFVIFHASW
ncbi:MAG TPA: hypothetical protein VME43_29710 [Bryobacteraceae bacterium]|nr:hypothetical protein [Bryobacteraceae bacterium]